MKLLDLVNEELSPVTDKNKKEVKLVYKALQTNIYRPYPWNGIQLSLQTLRHDERHLLFHPRGGGPLWECSLGVNRCHLTCLSQSIQR